MLCERCQKADALVHDMEILADVKAEDGGPKLELHHFCEACAHVLQLPHCSPVAPKPGINIWQSLLNPQMQPRRPAKQCPDCKMTEEELRRRGKVGCAKDYEIFADYLDALVQQMHGAHEHTGRTPGASGEDHERRQRMGDLREKLERAIREEDYECAAHLRDELRTLELEREA